MENHLKFDPQDFELKILWDRILELNHYLLYFLNVTQYYKLTDEDLKKMFMRWIPPEYHLKNPVDVHPYKIDLEELVQHYTKIEGEIDMEVKVKEMEDEKYVEETKPPKKKKSKNQKVAQKARRLIIKQVHCGYCGKPNHNESECRINK